MLPEREGGRSRAPAYFRLSLEDRYADEELAGFDVQHVEDVSVHDIMTREIFRVDESMPVQKVAEVLITGRIHRLLVTEGKEVVGLVSAHDLLQLIRDMQPESAA
jgi:signal-transduction protein with cAMP-binding, CBS, and nucleotidyltransferase domain